MYYNVYVYNHSYYYWNINHGLYLPGLTLTQLSNTNRRGAEGHKVLRVLHQAQLQRQLAALQLGLTDDGYWWLL